jgi:hypothetical protein
VSAATLVVPRSHRFAAPVDAVLAALSSEAYAAALTAHHPFFAEVEVLALHASERRITRRVRYRARPFIARLGPFSPAPEWFAWTEEAVLDRERAVLTFENVPLLQSVRDRFENRGSMCFRRVLDASGRAFTQRDARFEIAFRVGAAYRPLADLALSLVARQLESALDDEARLLAGWLSARAAQPAASAAVV